ncbi:hypothetical protein [Acidomonas methanolica]|uniref:hypothetical protein n=1 Tax=Acidomonas methanolica TaxID=437 RepID=UPI002119BDD3|nr:hypothetical protein [Acidomonas methanolica]MCQ9154051.1 hypothetical protein [Acidomonas methanolica]
MLALVVPFWTYLEGMFEHAVKSDGYQLETYMTPTQVSASSTDWSRTAHAIARGDRSLSPEKIAELLHAVPASQTARLQAALRVRLAANPHDGLALLDPVRVARFSGMNVCAGGSPAWKAALRAPLAAEHGLTNMYQRDDCMAAIAAPAHRRKGGTNTHP